MSVMNYTRLAMRQRDEQARHRSLQKVLDASERAAKITSGILGAARNRSASMESTCLKSLIEDTVVLIERELRKYRIQLHVHLDEVPPTWARGNEIQQVVLNLLINARQAMPNGGEITIRLSHDPVSRMNELTVRDNGCGIASADMEKIFLPFFTTKPPGQGTGLGLSTAYGIVKGLGGDITVTSELDAGTAFTVNLPMEPPPTESEKIIGIY